VHHQLLAANVGFGVKNTWHEWQAGNSRSEAWEALDRTLKATDLEGLGFQPLRTVAQLAAGRPLANVMRMSALIDRQKGGNPFFVRLLASFAFLALIRRNRNLCSHCLLRRTAHARNHHPHGARSQKI
jgi:hypothetical protein